MLDRDAIFSIAEAQTPHEVEVPEWNGSVFVRTLNGRELDMLMGEWHRLGAADGKNPARVFACVVAASACDENGDNLFTNADIDRIHRMPLGGVRRVAEAALEFNGLTEEMQGVIEGN